MPRLTSRAVQVDSEQWNGHLTDKLKNFLAGDLISHQATGLVVRTPDGPTGVPLGYWLLRWPDGSLLINSPAALVRAYEEDTSAAVPA